MMAHLEGALPAAVAAELTAHLGACAACQAEFATLKDAASALEALGEAGAAQVPVIDLTQAVLAGAAALREGRRALDHAGEPSDEVMAYLDGELDDFSVARIERERAKDPAFDAELTDLAALFSELTDLGAAVNAHVARVDLVASTVARARAAAVEQDALPEELRALPEGVRLAIERYMEGEASTAQVAELRAFAAGVPALAGLLDDYAALHGALEDMATEHARAVPRVDLVADVLSAARKLDRGNISRFRRDTGRRAVAVPSPAPARRTTWWISATAAAAACVLFGLYLGNALPSLTTGGASGNTDALAAKDVMRPVDPAVDGTALLPKGTSDATPEGELPAAPEGQAASASEGAPESAPELDDTSLQAARTLKELLDLRRQANEDDVEALARLVRWSSLSEAEARKILADKNADPAAVIGAAEFLPPAEAAEFLKAAIERNPDDPYLRKALAKAYAESGNTEMARQQLDEWARLDPENSLPLYMAARLAFQNGDMTGGLDYLHGAASYERGSLYAAQGAGYRQNALAANGYDADSARFLAASTAGTGDYRYASALANDLLEQGNLLREAGQYEEAEQLYLSVYNLGAQLSNGAQLVNDFDTAYNIQNSALQALYVLSRVFASIDPAMLDSLLGELNQGIAALADLMRVYENLFNGENLDQLLQLIAATLNGGQLDYLQR